jgi:hypothetical protein
MCSKWIITAITVGSLSAGLCFAAPKQPADPVQQALKDKYPDAKVEITRTRKINGVSVSDAKITTKDGETEAEVTEYGDILFFGTPRKGGISGISKPAAETVTGLLKGTPSDVDIFWVTNYLVDLGAGNRTFRLRFDPVGHLRDIDSKSGMAETNVQSMSKASQDEANKVEGYAKKYFPDAKINNVYKASGEEGFYLVDMTSKEGKNQRLTLSNDNKVLGRRDEVARDDLPKPVTDAIDRMFNGEKIKSVYRDDFQFYEIDQKDAAGDAITIRIRPNGEILNIQNVAADEEEKAQTAKHKETAKSGKKKGD